MHAAAPAPPTPYPTRWIRIAFLSLGVMLVGAGCEAEDPCTPPGLCPEVDGGDPDGGEPDGGEELTCHELGCGAGETCGIDGTCYLAAAACGVSSGCPEGSACDLTGACIVVWASCASDTHCAPGEACRDARCVPDPFPCVGDSDCLHGEDECGPDGYCVASPELCDRALDCGEGFFCARDGYCAPDQGACSTSIACPSGFFCASHGRCELGAATCPPGGCARYQEDGICTADGYPCASDRDCPEPLTCGEIGRCIPR